MKRKIQVDNLEIRRIRNAKGLSTEALSHLADIGDRTLKEIETTGAATPDKIERLAMALDRPGGIADLKPLLLSGPTVAEHRQRKRWTQKQLVDAMGHFQVATAELTSVSLRRLRQIESSALAVTMHHEWRLLSSALDCAPDLLLCNAATSQPTRLVSSVAVGQHARQLISLLMSQYDFTTGSLSEEAWTCSQALVGLLSFSNETSIYREELRSAFAYIDRLRLPSAEPNLADTGHDQGWPLWVHKVPPILLTDINCWVIVASALADQLGSIWTVAEREARAQSVLAEVQILLCRQFLADAHPQDGGFCPTTAVSSDNVRTYTTVMVLWALAAALDAFRSDPRSVHLPKIRNAIGRATLWLFRHFDSGRGWIPKPARVAADDESYLGLTAQAVYVLTRLRSHPNSPWPAAAEAAFAPIAKGYLDTLARRLGRLRPCERASNDVVDGADTWLHGTSAVLEGMTFYWWPWSLAATGRLSEQSRLPSECGWPRTRLLELRRRLLQRTPSPWPSTVPTFGTAFCAECLHALSVTRL
jgi:hypothetical protein